MTGSAPLASDDVLGGVAHAVDLDRARPGEPAAAAQQRRSRRSASQRAAAASE